jgi:uncharacterized membrane protein YqiK
MKIALQCKIIIIIIIIIVVIIIIIIIINFTYNNFYPGASLVWKSRFERKTKHVFA